MRDECQRYRLVVSQCERVPAQPRINRRMRQLHNRAAVRGQGVREFVVSMQPRNLFDDVDLALHIQPPTRNVYAELCISLSFGNKGESQALQQTEDQSSIQVGSQNPP